VATTYTSAIDAARSGRIRALCIAARRWWPVAAILLFALLYRLPTFGDPMLDSDEQLYLTVGDRMLHGHLPYVELWDRKPPGLFAIYAMIRLLGGIGVVQYQVVAALCAGITAALIFAMARRGASTGAALTVAIAYILYLNPLHGAGGQSPVLYNVLTALQAWLALRASDSARPRMVVGSALLATALAGIAIQCKYTPVVEGAYFGLVFLAQFRRVGLSTARTLVAAAAMVVLALLPTAVALGTFWHLGHLDAFVQANFQSVFARAPFPPERRFQQRALVALIGGPVVLMALVRALQSRRMPDGSSGTDRLILGGWCVAALVAFAMLGDFFDFYFITVMPPLLVFAAPLLDRGKRARMIVAAGLLIWPFFLLPPSLATTPQHRSQTAALVRAISPYVGQGRCLYVYDGPTILYHLTGACAPTRYIYPDHLNNPVEIPALGVDAVAEMRRLLVTRPGAIVVADIPLVPRVDAGTQAVLRRALERDYVRVARVQSERAYDVFALRSLHRGPGVLPHAPIEPR
jgi:hypothetical protein